MLIVRPMNESDLKDSTEIRELISNEDNILDQTINHSFDVTSKQPYNKKGLSDELNNSYSDFLTQTHIQLSFPIANRILTGDNCIILNRIIGDHVDCQGLNSGKYILQINEDGIKECISPNAINQSTIYNHRIHKIGGEAILLLLNDVDIECKIKSLILGTYLKLIPKKEFKLSKAFGTIVRNSKNEEDEWIIADYYIHYDDDTSDIIKQYVIQYKEEIHNRLIKASSTSGVSIPVFSLLIEFRDNPNKFKDMIQSFIPVLPLGFRPTEGKERDPLSLLYDRVVGVNNTLGNLKISTTTSLSTIRATYNNLYLKYTELLIRKNKYDSDRYIPLVDKFTGKEGIVRKNVQSSTIDFSGRCVITVDPNMSIDSVGIPRSMLLKLCELEVLDKFESKNGNKTKFLKEMYTSLRQKKAEELISGSYVVIGRQPTLYILGIQGFKVVVVDGHSIILNPLSTAAFNADFDGDQMHVSRPQTFEAQEEVKHLMANINNIFLPKDGTSHIAPRHEMIYGLNKCSTIEADVTSRNIKFPNTRKFTETILGKLKDYEVKISDKCTIDGKEFPTVGYAILKTFLGSANMQAIRLGVVPITRDASIPERPVKEEFFKELFKYIRLNREVQTFVDTVNRYVKVGFIIANLYPLDLNVLSNIDTSDLRKEFEDSLKERQEAFYLGWETEERFNEYYSNHYYILEKKVMERINNTLGNDNGFVQLIASGARGSKSNLMQIFGMKGTILKNGAETFTSIIHTPLARQLGGFEHFISAVGARQGVKDKVINTHDPGYLSRRMSHVARHLSIVTRDCGTTDGLLITYDEMAKRYSYDFRLSGNSVMDYYTIKEYTCNIMQTHYIVGQPSTTSPLTKQEAEQFFDKQIATCEEDKIIKKKGLKLRTPLTCKNPCCSQCYGLDLLTNRLVAVGTPIGNIAGPTLGEPATQLTMKQFQRGGVAGSRGLTSSFDKFNNLLELGSVSSNESNVPIIHDFISPVSGRIKKTELDNRVSYMQIQDEKGKNLLTKNILVYNNIQLKDFVNVGESIQKIQGTLDIKEILNIRGFEEGLDFLLFSAYNSYVNDAYTNFKYFNVIAFGMVFSICLKGNDYFKVGLYYSRKEIYEHDTTDCIFTEVLRGLTKSVEGRTDFLTSMYLENMIHTISRGVALSGKDSLTDPLVLATLGLKVNNGTSIPEYMKTRGV